jgi:hypothetical protein
MTRVLVFGQPFWARRTVGAVNRYAQLVAALARAIEGRL